MIRFGKSYGTKTKYNTYWYIMQKHIFNKYDIRGKVGVDLVLGQVDRLAHAIIAYYKKHYPNLERIAVALDGRKYSQQIYDKVSKAIVDAGLQVYFLGVCPTPIFVYSLYHLPVQAGIMITGSHMPAEYNGFKLYLDKKCVWGKEVQEIYQLFIDGVFVASDKVGKVVPSPILDQYVETLWNDFSYLSQYDFSMVIDCSHGSVGPVINKVIKKMGWKHVKVLHDNVDPAFPIHDPNPSDVRNMRKLHTELQKNDCSFGIGFDGDASCMIGMEQDGTLILGDRLLALFAQDVLKHQRNATIVYDVKSSMLVEEVIEQSGGIPVVSSSGAPLVKNKVDQVHAAIGGEVTGHYFFQDRHPGYDDGIYALFRLLDILVKERKSLYELLALLPKTYSSYEIRIPCVEEEKHEIVQDVGKFILAQKGWKVSTIDGVRAEINEGWGLLRACHTQPMVSFRCEARNKDDLLTLKKEFKELLKHRIKSDVLKEYF